MTDQVAAFIQAMRDEGLGPTDAEQIIPDDVRRYYHVEGDKPKVKRGSYVLRVDPDGFACGGFMTLKDQHWHKWHSRSKRKATDDEKAAWKERLAADRLKREQEELELRSKAADKCALMWSEAKEGGSHPYVERKGLFGLHGARVWLDVDRGETALLVPCIRHDGKMVGLQRIYADGEKLFVYGGEKQGCWFTIEGEAGKLIICEGFATGATLHEATGATVVVAFDAGNLKAVALEVVKVYGAGVIVFAADNDFEGDSDGVA